ncbi:MAG: ABC transporter ATP-binding protein [Tenuifilaceae bacterium]|jgi:lipoprotein-releasing system ATP-binding protein|nr:ABC transporter ATP-binding protein [Bacteroidales bacterium]MDY0255429.1 ABC transporter ATP-binding protein [Tenuifilaceae bacterium]
MITAKGIFKSYGKVKVLKDIDFHVSKGEIVSIVGPSGAGKSTLLQIIGTIEQADQGSLSINDLNINDLSGKSLAAFRNQKIGFVFQFHHLFPEFTALENVCIPAFIAGKTKKQAEKEALQLLEYLNVIDRKEHKPAAMSGGEQQRVAVARALINQPAVVLADEPSGNLDTHSAAELHKLFLDLRQKFNQTFVIVTHNTDLANMADKSYTLADGSWQ